VLALSTVHSLPSPVPRRSQKFAKPTFFDVRKKEIEAWNSLCDVRAWMSAAGGSGAWSLTTISTELGAVLTARDKFANGTHAPSSHRAFSRLPFVRNAGGGRFTELREGDRGQEEGGVGDGMDGMDGIAGKGRDVDTDKTGGWLEGDDIEEW
jgi:cell cycle checkpoint protein